MTAYEDLRGRIDGGEVIILDGAVGTQLQGLGVPIGVTAWAGIAQHSHPDTVRFMHETYIEAGVDIITTNTYSSARTCLEPLGLGDLTRELNLRAVVLAQEARARKAKERPVYIAGAVSNYGILTGNEPLPEIFRRDWSDYTEEQCKANLREQAEILVESGVDFLLAECTGSGEHTKWVSEACLATGLPTWPGFKAYQGDDGALLMGHYSDEPFEECLDAVLPLGGDLMTIFHTTVDATTEAIPVLQDKWSGPIAVYPDADRRGDYVSRRQDPNIINRDNPKAFLESARGWVGQGAQVIGACCGFGFEYIRPLREGLPSHVPTPGSRTGTEG
jgi:S-methylmethionine-dependent homocysteine/selenocysteine methylase